jgi:hypothetical protein
LPRQTGRDIASACRGRMRQWLRRTCEETETASQRRDGASRDKDQHSQDQHRQDQHSQDQHVVRPRRYGLLLAVMILSYLMSAFITATWILFVQLVLFTTAGLLALRNSPFRRRTTGLVVAGALVALVVMIVGAAVYGGNQGYGVASLWTAILLLLTVLLLVRQIISVPVVTLQSIFGALSAYLIIGLMFSAVYAAMYRLGGDHFFTHGQLQDSRNVTPIFQYFSFTTLTTLGYGDFTAASTGGRAVAVLEAVTGQIFLATLVARLVAAFRPAAGQPGGGQAADSDG